MLKFLTLLIDRYLAVLGSDDLSEQRSQTLRESLTSLILAEATLKRRQLRRDNNLPLQVAVIGPTQVGKSSVANWLLGAPMARASARASHTVHCSGFARGDAWQHPEPPWAEQFFSGMTRRDSRHLDRQASAEYSIEAADAPAAATLPGSVIWDTPDFDSVQSFRYRLPVLRAIALADLVVLVVSAEKYADKTVWDMLEQLHALDQPLQVVFNKAPAGDAQQQLYESFESKYQARFNAAAPPLHFVEYFATDSFEAALQRDDVSRLVSQVAQHVTPVSEDPAAIQRYLRNHWPAWTGAAEAEQQAVQDWNDMVATACSALQADYSREYLEHTRKDEILKLALAELLVLLEIPGVAEPLIRLRSIVTWPVRQLMSRVDVGQASAAASADDVSEESRLLSQMGDHAVSQLAIAIDAHPRQPANSRWWLGVSDRFSDQRSVILERYQGSIDEYQAELKIEIRNAANSLYEKLQQQPATLNSLRAARVSADAAAVVLAVKSGGLGLADLVIAPAMLSLTTMLTEGALGQYMEKVQADLKAHQLTRVEQLIDNRLAKPLTALGNETETAEWSGISAQQMAAAKSALEHGNV